MGMWISLITAAPGDYGFQILAHLAHFGGFWGWNGIMATSERMNVGIVVERRDIDNPWEDHCWSAVAVIPGTAPDFATDEAGDDGAGEDREWPVLDQAPGVVRYFAGTLPIEIFRRETEGYLLNLSNEPPVVYVVLRFDDDAPHGIEPFLATVCPFEAQVLLDGDEDLVEPVPMPIEVAAWLKDFVTEHHVDQPLHKRKRKPHDPRKGGPPPDAPGTVMDGRNGNRR